MACQRSCRRPTHPALQFPVQKISEPFASVGQITCKIVVVAIAGDHAVRDHAATLAVGACDGFDTRAEHSPNGLLERHRIIETGHVERARGFLVTFQRRAIKIRLAAEGRIQARCRDADRRRQLADRDAFITMPPKHPHRDVEGMLAIEAARPAALRVPVRFHSDR
jgi:hypothetical protein